MRISHISAARRLCPRVAAPLRLHRCQSSITTANLPPPLAVPPESLSLSEWSATVEEELIKLASRPLRPLTLADLIRFGRPPLSPKSLLASARFTRENLPVRLSRRILALRNLPFIIVSNPHVSQIFDNYRQSLRAIIASPLHPTTPAEEHKFTETLTDIVKTHSNTIPTLARGFLECRRYTTPAEVTSFLDQHLRERIGTRLMAEQHIALHLASTTSPEEAAAHTAIQDLGGDASTYIGTIDTALQPARLIHSCSSFVGDICELRYGVRPQIVIDGDPDVRFPYIPVHLEYIATELLKNAFRATVEAGATDPVRITIAKDPYSEGISMRVRDRGGGISPDDFPNIWSYSFTTFSNAGDENEDDALGRFNTGVASVGDGSSIAGLGYGLPLSRAYAEYFGGSLQVQSAYGWGTDVYLKLKGVAVDTI
ncbi:dehydrogenase kinase [Sphaerosporella brunnea]|uniref:Protein-serine/threonine kinase n=1 Tax=Sphaerosporella brunnea TaxID=1250544 RepID=A0A5J5F2Q9_9PEZI|nr:dehydrogenase kinase [Sphaerosporella brunnea]